MAAPTRARSSAARRDRACQSIRRGAALGRRQCDVLGDAEMRKKRRLLVDRGDAQRAGRGRVDAFERLSGEGQGPGVGLFGAGDDPDEGRFPCTVLPDQGMNLSGVELERHALQRADGTEGFCDGCRLEERARHAEDVTARPERRGAPSQVHVIPFDHRVRRWRQNARGAP